MKKIKRIVGSIPFLAFVFLIFLGIYLYPFISDKWNAYRAKQLIVEYQSKTSSEESVQKYEKECLAAQEYNKKIASLTDHVVTGPLNRKDDEYETLLNMNDEGMMGYIEIPKMQVDLPIYHYSDEDVLLKGAGHVLGSSLPVGGVGTHSLITGHRGLPESKFFTDLDKMEKDDKFYLHVAGLDLAYKVVKIETVLPSEVDGLLFEKDRDLVTLITCTPYGTNTHRLLVTGERCEYDLEEKKTAAEEGRVIAVKDKFTAQNGLVLGLVVFVVVLCAGSFTGRKRRKK